MAALIAIGSPSRHPVDLGSEPASSGVRVLTLGCQRLSGSGQLAQSAEVLRTFSQCLKAWLGCGG